MGLDRQENEESLDESEHVEATNNRQQVEHATPIYTYFLVGLIIVVFLTQLAFASIPTQVPEADRTVLLAGFVKPLFLMGEYWRILTGGTVHSGIVHVAFNSYALYVLGKLFEVLSNRSHLAIVFILSIIGGGSLSLIFLNSPSVGASGGVIGFLGYLTAYGFKRRKLLPSSFLKNMIFNIALIAVLGIFVIPNVDNFGHLGGFIVGIVYGFAQVPSDLYKDPREASQVAHILGYIALGIFILTCIFTILLLSNVISFDYSFIR